MHRAEGAEYPEETDGSSPSSGAHAARLLFHLCFPVFTTACTIHQPDASGPLTPLVPLPATYRTDTRILHSPPEKQHATLHPSQKSRHTKHQRLGWSDAASREGDRQVMRNRGITSTVGQRLLSAPSQKERQQPFPGCRRDE